MNVSLNWLKEYVDVPKNLEAKDIAYMLTMTGTKVENITKFGEKVTNVVTGKILEIEKHKDDEKTSILKIDVGSKTLTALAKIPDIQIGMIVPIALDGAKLATKEIKTSEVMGVKSECMVCHILDLGIDSRDFAWSMPSGLISFPKDTPVGTNIVEVLGLGDYVIEFEITPNRPDCLSVEGLAIELAATLNLPCKNLSRESYDAKDNKVVSSLEGITVDIQTDKCSRYMMKVAKDIRIEAAPYDMQLKLIKSGIRPINNIVDITNYVMLEIGQPLHAFDRQNIENNIYVRDAKDGETLTTLDGQIRNLSANTMVIANSKEPMAIAGVMGGELSGIKDDTTEIVIESASFERGAIRKASKEYSMRTDASGKYEKGLPPELINPAINKVAEYITKYGYGKVIEGTVDNYKQKQKETDIKVDYEYINKYIGINLSIEEIDKLLEKVNLKVKDGIINVPYFRQDISIREDLVEEVARLYGYENIPSTLPEMPDTFGSKTIIQKAEDKLLNTMTANSYNEIYTYTFFGEAMLTRINVKPEDKLAQTIKIRNPLSKEFEFMRTTLIPHMLETLERNYTKKNESARLFEYSKVFSGKDEVENKNMLAKEEKILSIGMYGNSSYYEIKEVVESLIDQFGMLKSTIEIQRCKDNNIYHPGKSANIYVNNKLLATIGELSPLVAKNYNLPKEVCIAEVYTEVLFDNMNNVTKFKELPKYPAVERDLAIKVKQEIMSIEIEKAISSVDKRIEKIELFDVYTGEQIEKGFKSMAYKLNIRDENKTLEEKEITETMSKIIEVLEKEVNAEIRK